MNSLYYGDNLNVLREYIKDESIDLIYLDPPFNSRRDYNVLYNETDSISSEAQLKAFKDTWYWDREAESAYYELTHNKNISPKLIEMISSFRSFMGENDMMAYLVMMAIRLVELYRVLKPTGSLYLHCDPTASHYLKILLDMIFRGGFRNEIIWKRTSNTGSSKAIAKKFPQQNDIILFYSKENYFYKQLIKGYSEKYLKRFKYKDEKGYYRLSPLKTYSEDRFRDWLEKGLIVYPGSKDALPSYKQYIDESRGVVIGNLWDDINPINPMAKERLGYPTQKPLALLERIINASSNEGDIILDPFCGCGTAVIAGQTLNRKWIGIDVTHLAINLIKWRLEDSFKLKYKKDYAVIGEPNDIRGALQLAKEEPFQFQYWALSLVNARPVESKGKKGKDFGVDGLIFFSDDNLGKIKKIIVQVKGGKTGSKDIRDLIGTIENQKAEMGIFICTQNITKDMQTEAVKVGKYHSEGWNKDYSKIQIYTLEELMEGKKTDLPPDQRTFNKAERIEKTNYNNNHELNF